MYGLKYSAVLYVSIGKALYTTNLHEMAAAGGRRAKGAKSKLNLLWVVGSIKDVASLCNPVVLFKTFTMNVSLAGSCPVS